MLRNIFLVIISFIVSTFLLVYSFGAAYGVGLSSGEIPFLYKIMLIPFLIFKPFGLFSLFIFPFVVFFLIKITIFFVSNRKDMKKTRLEVKKINYSVLLFLVVLFLIIIKLMYL